MEPIGILIETKDGVIKKANFGMIRSARGEGRRLFAIILDGDGEAFKNELQAHGIDTIVPVVTSQGQIAWNPEAWSRALMEAMAHYRIHTLLGLTTAKGREILPRIAAQLNASLVLDCLSIDLTRHTAVKSRFSGKTLATVALEGARRIYGIRPNAIAPEPSPAEAHIEVFTGTLPKPGLTLCETREGEGKGVDLSEADIIISGGRAMADRKNFSIIEDCAGAMGAAVGASRAAVDAGYADYSRQVGQTGTTVSPKLYIACGISGAVQHFAGMKTSKIIVAVNTDPAAPIVGKCDYFLHGDLFEIVPLLTKRLKEVGIA